MEKFSDGDSRGTSVADEKADLDLLPVGLALRDTLAKRLDILAAEIAAERNHPWLQLRTYFAYRLLTALARCSPPIPGRMAARFARSAFRKDPNRSLAGSDLPADAPARQLASQGWIKYPGSQPQDPARQTILIVSHDASLTGAPILALNLIQSLSARYNVAALVLGGNEILDQFKTHATVVYASDGVGSLSYAQRIKAICRAHPFAFAVVNSVEARAVLKHLRAEGVATVSLLHEFASYVQPNARGTSAFAEVFEHASQVVFSTQLTQAAAQDQNPRVDMTRAHVLAQGKCVVPEIEVSAVKRAAETARLHKALRPGDADEKRVVVIGAGTVGFRKGVDLFIEMAARVSKMPGAGAARFFWIGPRYDPDHDLAYSAYLRDQIARSGLGQRMTMLRETTEIELAYSLADLFVLPSRLDPLPNVTIDALWVGLPVLCFENASGTAGLLTEAGLKEACVAQYIDTRDLADKVFALITDPARRAKVSAQSRDFAATAFDFGNYAGKIEALGLQAAAAMAAQ